LARGRHSRRRTGQRLQPHRCTEWGNVFSWPSPSRLSFHLSPKPVHLPIFYHSRSKKPLGNFAVGGAPPRIGDRRCTTLRWHRCADGHRQPYVRAMTISGYIQRGCSQKKSSAYLRIDQEQEDAMAQEPLATKGNFLHIYDFRVTKGKEEDFIRSFEKFDYSD